MRRPVRQLEVGPGDMPQGASAGGAGGDDHVGLPARLPQARQVLRLVLAVGVHRDHARVAVRHRVAQSRLDGAPGALPEGRAQDGRAARARDRGGVVGAAVVDDQHVDVFVGARAGDHPADAVGLVERGHDDQQPAGARGGRQGGRVAVVLHPQRLRVHAVHPGRDALDGEFAPEPLFARLPERLAPLRIPGERGERLLPGADVLHRSRGRRCVPPARPR